MPGKPGRESTRAPGWPASGCSLLFAQAAETDHAERQRAADPRGRLRHRDHFAIREDYSELAKTLCEIRTRQTGPSFLKRRSECGRSGAIVRSPTSRGHFSKGKGWRDVRPEPKAGPNRKAYALRALNPRSLRRCAKHIATKAATAANHVLGSGAAAIGPSDGLATESSPSANDWLVPRLNGDDETKEGLSKEKD